MLLLTNYCKWAKRTVVLTEFMFRRYFLAEFQNGLFINLLTGTTYDKYYLTMYFNHDLIFTVFVSTFNDIFYRLQNQLCYFLKCVL